MSPGNRSPASFEIGLASPRENPRRSNQVAAPTPPTSPNRPATAVPSRPARRRPSRQVQPRKTSAPTLAKTPRRKRTSGAEPPRERKLPKTSAARSPPSTRAGTSGRRYWTGAARWRPRAPTTSRSKQTTQTPMFGGLPNSSSAPAIRPISAAPITSPTRLFSSVSFIESLQGESRCSIRGLVQTPPEAGGRVPFRVTPRGVTPATQVVAPTPPDSRHPWPGVAGSAPATDRGRLRAAGSGDAAIVGRRLGQRPDAPSLKRTAFDRSASMSAHSCSPECQLEREHPPHGETPGPRPVLRLACDRSTDARSHNQ